MVTKGRLPGSVIGQVFQAGTSTPRDFPRYSGIVAKGLDIKLFRDVQITRAAVVGETLPFSGTTYTAPLAHPAVPDKQRSKLYTAEGREVGNTRWNFTESVAGSNVFDQVLIDPTVFSTGDTYLFDYVANDPALQDEVPVDELREVQAVGDNQGQILYREGVDYRFVTTATGPTPGGDNLNPTQRVVTAIVANAGNTGTGSVAHDSATYTHDYNRTYVIEVTAAASASPTATATVRVDVYPTSSGSADLPGRSEAMENSITFDLDETVPASHTGLTIEHGITLDFAFGATNYVLGDKFTFDGNGPGLLELADQMLNTNQFPELSAVTADVLAGDGDVTVNPQSEYTGPRNQRYEIECTAASGTGATRQATFQWRTVPVLDVLTGTVTATNGSATVTGSGTEFAAEVQAGDFLFIGADVEPVEVLSVTDATTLVLTVAYDPATQAGVKALGYREQTGQTTVLVGAPNRVTIDQGIFLDFDFGAASADNFGDARSKGQIDCDASATGVVVLDTETFDVSDGTTLVTYEFDDNASVVETPTLRRVDITGAADEDDVKDAIILAVTNTPTFNVSAEDGGAGIVLLTNDNQGTAGDVAIDTTGVASADFVATGMTGGAAEGDTFSFIARVARNDYNGKENRNYDFTVTDTTTLDHVTTMSFAGSTALSTFGSHMFYEGNPLLLPNNLVLHARNNSLGNRFDAIAPEDTFDLSLTFDGLIDWTLEAPKRETIASSDILRDLTGETTGTVGAYFILLDKVPTTINYVRGPSPTFANITFNQVANTTVVWFLTDPGVNLTVDYLFKGAEPQAGATYFMTGFVKRPDSDYESGQLFTTKDAAVDFLAPMTPSNDAAIANEIAWDQDELNLPGVVVFLVRDSDSDGIYTTADYNQAIDVAEQFKGTMDLVVVNQWDAREELRDSTVNMNDPTVARRRIAYFGFPTNYPIGDAFTEGTRVFAARRELQVFEESVARGTLATIGNSFAKKTILVEPLGNSDAIGAVPTQVTLDGSFLAVALAARVASFNEPWQTVYNLSVAGFDEIEVLTEREMITLQDAGIIAVRVEGGSGFYQGTTTTDETEPSTQQLSGTVQRQYVLSRLQDVINRRVVGFVADSPEEVAQKLSGEIVGELGSLVSEGKVGRYIDATTGVSRPLSPERDVVAFRDRRDPTRAFFRASWWQKYPILFVDGLVAVDAPTP